MQPLRVGMTLPEIPGSPSYLRTGTPHLAKFLYDLGYTTGEFGKNHLGDTTESLPTAHGFQEYWGYLYHLDAMQGVSFPDINKSPTEQTVAPPCKNTPIPGLSEFRAVDPKTVTTQTTCLTPPRPVLLCKSSDGTQANQSCKDEGPLTLDRSKTVDEESAGRHGWGAWALHGFVSMLLFMPPSRWDCARFWSAGRRADGTAVDMGFQSAARRDDRSHGRHNHLSPRRGACATTRSTSFAKSR